MRTKMYINKRKWYTNAHQTSGGITVVQLHTVERLSEILSVTERTIRDWARKGYITGFKVGGEWRFSQDDLDEFLEQQRQEAQLQFTDQELEEAAEMARYQAPKGNVSHDDIVTILAAQQCPSLTRKAIENRVKEYFETEDLV